MRVKGAPGWNRGPRQKGAFRSVAYPSGGWLRGQVRSSGSWDVWLELGGGREYLNKGTYSGPLRKGCDAADISMNAILLSARQSKKRRKAT